MSIILRPLTHQDMPFGHVGDTEFEDFGPREQSTQPPPCRLDDDGHLGVEVEERLVGSVGWHWVGYGPGISSRCPMIGVWIAEEERGKGYGKECQAAVTDLIFRYTLVNRVEASTDVTNTAEQRTLESIGFVREGIIRGSQYRAGAFHDLVMYSALRAEWTTRRPTGEVVHV